MITVEMGNSLIHEHFSNSVNQYFGQSWSVYDTLSNKWKQTWVDNSGEYLDFQGGLDNEKMILQRSYTNKKGQTILSEWCFSILRRTNSIGIGKVSTDAGVNWKSQWKIHYRRKS